MLSNEEINGGQEIKKQICLSLNLNEDEFLLIISSKDNQIILNLHSILHPEFKFENHFEYQKMKDETQLFKISNNINEAINLISECIKSKYYSLTEKNEEMILNISSMIPGIKNVDFILKKNFSVEEEIVINQYKKQEELIKLLKNEINQLKESNKKKENEISELKNIIITNQKKQIDKKEKILKKIEEYNIKTQKNFNKIINTNQISSNDKENYSISGFLSNILSMIKGFAFHSKFLYWENKENNINSFEVMTLSLFPNNNIIISSNQNFQILNNNLNKIIYNYENSHDKKISCFCIIDNNNFLTGSEDKTIKKWKIENEKINLIDTLQGHNRVINKIIYLENSNIISCSNDHTVKIWEKIKEYQCIKTFEHKETVRSILLFDNNTLISGDYNGQLKIWDLNNLQEKFSLNKCEVLWYESLKKIDNERIIVGGKFDKIMKVINISQKKIIQYISSNFVVYSINILKNGFSVFGGGTPFNIDIRDNQKFDLIQSISTNYQKCINIIVELNNGDLLVSNDEKKIKVFCCNM